MSLDWYPIIDQGKCTECRICYEFCPHDVYILKDDKPIIARPEDCVTRCHGCERKCPSDAISYYGDDGKHSAPKAILLPKL